MKYWKRLLSFSLSAVLLTPVLASCSSGNNVVVGRDGYDLKNTAYIADAATDLPSSLEGLSVTSASASRGIVPTDAVFTVKTQTKADKTEIAKYLSVSPAADYSLTQESDTEFTLIPSSQLDPQTVYRFTLGDADNPVSSFAFQTSSEFAVASSLPADLAVGVPLNTGIEFTFPECVSKTDFTKYFSISPAISGRFEVYPNGKTFVFIPGKDLAKNTVYEITLKKGFPADSGKTLEADYNMKFRTGSDASDQRSDSENVSLSFYDRDMTAPTGSPYEVGYFLYSGKKELTENDIRFTVYQYNGAAQFADALKTYENKKADAAAESGRYVFPTDGLTKVAEGETPVIGPGEKYSRRSFALPLLESGIYLVNFTVSGKCGSKNYSFDTQLSLQITDLQVQAQSCNGETLVWVNQSGKPVSGAEIAGDAYLRTNGWGTGKDGFTALEAKTDADGLALLETGENNAAILCIRCNGEEYVHSVYTGESSELNYFGSSLYTDREVYFSNDTVRFFGIVKPFCSAKMPGKLLMKVGGVNLGTVRVDSDGTFTGTLPIEDYSGWGMSLSLVTEDGQSVAYKYISVTQEEKPVYQASLEYDKLFYRRGEQAVVTLTSTFFDGTPAPNIEFYVSENLTGYGSTVVTDENGKAEIVIEPDPYYQAYSHSTLPVSLYVNAELIGLETSRVYISKSAYYFHSDFQFLNDWEAKDKVVFTLCETDTSEIETEEDFGRMPEIICGKAIGDDVQVRLIKHWYTKNERREYNPITKVTNTYYDYIHHESTVWNKTIRTEDGKIVLDRMNADGFDGYYVYEAVYSGFELSAYASEYVEYTSTEEIYPKTDKNSYRIGETVSVAFVGGDAPENVLYTVCDENGLVLRKVANDGKFSFEYTGDMVRRCQITVSYFSPDGKIIAPTLGVGFDFLAENELTIEILPDKDVYRPGEQATVTLKITDKDGNPVSGGIAALGIVDEACFAVGDQKLDPLARYFGSTDDYYYYDYSYYYSGRYAAQKAASHRILIDSMIRPFSEAAEIGNLFLYRSAAYGMDLDDTGGMKAEAADTMEEAESPAESEDREASDDKTGTHVRKEFSDNPVFETVKTGANGTALITYTVPDNITEWRITALGFGGFDGKAYSDQKLGVSVTDVICTQPYFINLSNCKFYIEGDDVTVSARSYGVSLTLGTEARYEAVLTDENGKEIAEKTVTAVAGEYAWFNFGKLPLGSYQVTVNAECGDHKDALVGKFDVRKTANSVSARRDLTPGEIKTINPVAYPVSLSFYDGNVSLYTQLVRRLRYEAYTRTDAKAAYAAALTASGRLFGTDESEELDKLVSELNSSTGLFGIYDYAQPDIRLTAKIVSTLGSSLSTYRRGTAASQLEYALNNKYYQNDAEFAAALAGLAALDQPVLDTLYAVAGGCSEFSTEAKYWLSAAFAFAGDYSAAKQIYDDLMSSGSVREGDLLNVKGKDSTESIDLTAVALLTAARISRSDAEAMIRYLLLHESAHPEYLGLSYAAYLRCYMPLQKTETHLKYKLGGEEKEVTLGAGQIMTLTLTADAFRSLEILEADEAIRVHAAYETTLEEAFADKDESSDAGITLNKTITDLGNNLYRVTISFKGSSDRPHLYLNVEDTIPTGARFVSSIGGDSSVSVTGEMQGYAGIRQENGQQMKGYVSIYPNRRHSNVNIKKVDEYSYHGTLSYIIRGAVTGEFIAESPVITDPSADTFSIGERTTLIIK